MRNHVVLAGLVVLCVTAMPCVGINMKVVKSFPLGGDGKLNVQGFMVVADLNGDGELDFVHSNGERTTKAFDHTGRLLWEVVCPLGRVNKDEVHPTVTPAWDLDGDGKAEVITFGRDEQGGYICILDGPTGTLRHKYYHQQAFYQLKAVIGYVSSPDEPWILMAGEDASNRLLVFDRTLSLIRIVEAPKAGHHIYPIDVDEDGLHEILFGKYIIDNDLSILWQVPDWLPWDHVDAISCGDIDPRVPGLEIAYNGISGFHCYNFPTRQKLWSNSDRSDPQNQAIGNFDQDSPGLEIIISGKTKQPGEKDGEILVDSQGRGRFLGNFHKHIHQACDLDGDRREDEALGTQGYVIDKNGKYLLRQDWVYSDQRVPKQSWTRYPFAVDLLGDSREEIVHWGEKTVVIGQNMDPAPDALGPSWRGTRDYMLRLVNTNYNRSTFYFDYKTGRQPGGVRQSAGTEPAATAAEAR